MNSSSRTLDTFLQVFPLLSLYHTGKADGWQAVRFVVPEKRDNSREERFGRPSLLF